MQKKRRFYELLETHLTVVLNQKFPNGTSVDDGVLRLMFDTIKSTITGLFDQSSHKLTAEALSWLSTQYFKGVRVNAEDRVSDLIVTNEHDLALMPYDDIKLMNDLFAEASVGEALVTEMKRRSLS